MVLSLSNLKFRPSCITIGYEPDVRRALAKVSREGNALRVGNFKEATPIILTMLELQAESLKWNRRSGSYY
jgi:hypothetical protein